MINPPITAPTTPNKTFIKAPCLSSVFIIKDAKKIYVRKSSTKRDDVRNGACEIIFVSEFEIVREHKVVNKYYQKPLAVTALTSAVLGFLMFLIN